jgi:hypothetical protein
VLEVALAKEALEVLRAKAGGFVNPTRLALNMSSSAGVVQATRGGGASPGFDMIVVHVVVMPREGADIKSLQKIGGSVTEVHGAIRTLLGGETAGSMLHGGEVVSSVQASAVLCVNGELAVARGMCSAEASVEEPIAPPTPPNGDDDWDGPTLPGGEKRKVNVGAIAAFVVCVLVAGLAYVGYRTRFWRRLLDKNRAQQRKAGAAFGDDDEHDIGLEEFRVMVVAGRSSDVDGGRDQVEQKEENEEKEEKEKEEAVRLQLRRGEEVHMPEMSRVAV